MYNISIVIPVHKPNLKILNETLHNIALYPCEIVVVQNPEITEDVKNLCKKYACRIVSSELGANNARNTGIHYAQHDIIYLLDDDCIPKPTNLFYIKENINNGVDCIGGRVDLLYPDNPPKWLITPFTNKLAKLDWGYYHGPLLKHSQYLVSANLAFTKDIYRRVGGFNSNLGYFGRNLISNDEVLFVRDCSNLGKTFYDHRIAVDHIIPEFRTTEEYIIKKYYAQAQADYLLNKECKIETSIFVQNVRQVHYQNAKEILSTDDYKEWLRIYNACDVAYKIGQIDANKERNRCENIYSLLRDELGLV